MKFVSRLLPQFAKANARRTLSLNTEKDDATSGRLPSVLHAERRAHKPCAADHGLSAAAGQGGARRGQDGDRVERRVVAPVPVSGPGAQGCGNEQQGPEPFAATGRVGD